MSTLLVYASARELAALGRPPIEALELGVGKIAAAMNLSAALAIRRPDAVLLAGVGGAYPHRHLRAPARELALRSLVLVGSDRSIDDGVLTPAGFSDLAHLQIAGGRPMPADPELTAKLAERLACPIVDGATVSTGAGLDALSLAYALRSGAQVETMEGAAVAAVCERFSVPLVQLRAVSNHTGDRDRGGWDLEGAAQSLAKGLLEIFAAPLLP